MPELLSLDPSTKTGYIVLDIETGKILSRGEITFPKKKGMLRLRAIESRLQNIISMYNIQLSIIEGYGFANKFTLVTLVEIGTILRHCLHSNNIEYLEIPPTSLKKFLGKGNMPKDKMRIEVYKRWNFENDSDNVIDAYVLSRIGLAILGKLDILKYQRDAILSIKSVVESKKCKMNIKGQIK